MKVFLFVFNDYLGTHETLLKFLDKHPKILNWMALFNNTFLLVSEYDDETLSNMIYKRFKRTNKEMFIITEIDIETTQGLLPEFAWEFIADPEPAEESSD